MNGCTAYDICAATGKKMVITPEHDGRLTDLVLLDIAKKLKKQLAGRTIILQIKRRADRNVSIWQQS